MNVVSDVDKMDTKKLNNKNNFSKAMLFLPFNNTHIKSTARIRYTRLCVHELLYLFDFSYKYLCIIWYLYLYCIVRKNWKADVLKQKVMERFAPAGA